MRLAGTYFAGRQKGDKSGRRTGTNNRPRALPGNAPSVETRARAAGAQAARDYSPLPDELGPLVPLGAVVGDVGGAIYDEMADAAGSRSAHTRRLERDARWARGTRQAATDVLSDAPVGQQIVDFVGAVPGMIRASGEAHAADRARRGLGRQSPMDTVARVGRDIWMGWPEAARDARARTAESDVRAQAHDARGDGLRARMERRVGNRAAGDDFWTTAPAVLEALPGVGLTPDLALAGVGAARFTGRQGVRLAGQEVPRALMTPASRSAADFTAATGRNVTEREMAGAMTAADRNSGPLSREARRVVRLGAPVGAVVGAGVVDAANGSRDDNPILKGLGALGGAASGAILARHAPAIASGAIKAGRDALLLDAPPGELTRLMGSQTGMFAGPQARTADHAARARAVEMTAQGIDRDTIWRETGWGQGADGKWRFEIDDSGARLTQAQRMSSMEDYDRISNEIHGRNYGTLPFDGPNGKLGPTRQAIIDRARSQLRPDREVMTGQLDHPDLYDAYPQVGQVRTFMGDKAGPGNGYFDGSNNLINLDTKDHIGDVLHENQHVIQREENLGRGASAESYLSGPRSAMNQARAVHQMRNRVQMLNEGVVEAANYVAKHGGLEVNNLIRLDIDFPGDQLDRHIETLRREMQDIHVPSAMDMYRRSSGEVEARNTANRADFTPEQRRARPPWETEDVPRDKQIVRYDGDRMESRPPPPRPGAPPARLLGDAAAPSAGAGPIETLPIGPASGERAPPDEVFFRGGSDPTTKAFSLDLTDDGYKRTERVVFLSNNREMAEQFGQVGEYNVTGKIAHVEWPDADPIYDPEVMRRVLDDAERGGFDAVRISGVQNFEGGALSDVVAVFNKDNVRRAPRASKPLP